MLKLNRRAWLALSATAAAVTLGGSVALASTAFTPATAGTPQAVYACEATGHVTVTILSTPSAKCPTGTKAIVIGAQGVPGTPGAPGKNGTNGTPGVDGTSVTVSTEPAGANCANGGEKLVSASGTAYVCNGADGTNGTSPQPVTANALFNLTDRPDSGGNGNWANDDITRDVTVTRHGSVPASDCGSGATKCWFYTMTVGDTGTFTTISGAFTPNQGGSLVGTKINGVVTGSLSGGGDQEFYADQAAPAVPTTLAYSGSSPVSTSEWYKLFFPATANFGLAPATSAGQPWTTWSWSYAAPNTCETWTDSFANSGGQGTGAGQGNITGVNACTG